MNQDMLIKVAEAEPEIMIDTCNMMDITERLAPEVYEDLMDEMQAIFDYTDAKCKEAGLTTKAQYAAIGVAASVGAGLLSSLATDLHEAAKRGLTKGRNWKRIMEAHPNMREEVAFPERIKPAFNTLHHYAPDLMSDPLVGGSMLRALANQPHGNEHGFIKTVLDTRKSYADSRGKNFPMNSKVLEGVLPERPRPAGDNHR